MVQGNAILVVDLGNSSTKGKVLFGKDSQTGKYRERKFELSNIFATIPEDYEVSVDYSDLTSTILNVDASLDDITIKGHFCNGELQQNERSVATIRPTAKLKKYESESTVLSYRLAFLFACKAIMNMSRVSEFSQLDITWTVVTLLPPGDISAGSDKIKAIIEDIKEVNSVYPKADIPIKITKTVVLPEGYCAYVGTVYDVGHVFRPDYKFLTEEVILVLDIGAGTTDCVLIKNNKLVQNSKNSISLGGNNVFQLVKKKILVSGIDVDDESVREGVIKGFIKDGAKKVSIIDEVNQAKEEVARQIVSGIIGYFEGSDINVRNIGYILVCGGGSMVDSECEEIPPISKQILNNIKQMAKNCELVDIPTHIVQKEQPDGDVEKVEEQISPRDLNLIGASIMAELL